MIQIYHNPRCRKSREGLAILQEAKIEFEIIKYLDTPPSKQELSHIIDKLNIKPIELVRTKEVIWKDNFKGKELSDDEVLDAMISYPKLIERPIVIKDNKAVLGRPPETISSLL